MKLRAKGEPIKKLIAEHGLGAVGCAKEVGLAEYTVRGFMNGNTCIPKTVKTFCDYFKINMWDYFEIED